MHKEKKFAWLVIQVAGKSKQLGRCLARTLLAVSQHSGEVERKMATCPMGVCVRARKEEIKEGYAHSFVIIHL